MSKGDFFKLNLLDCLVLLNSICTYKEADNDADQTVSEMVRRLEQNEIWVPKTIFESGLYCCNMQDEEKDFWHPQGKSFDTFLAKVIPKKMKFDKMYNLVSNVECLPKA